MKDGYSITIKVEVQIKRAAVKSRVAGKPHGGSTKGSKKHRASVIVPHPIHEMGFGKMAIAWGPHFGGLLSTLLVPLSSLL